MKRKTKREDEMLVYDVMNQRKLSSYTMFFLKDLKRKKII